MSEKCSICLENLDRKEQYELTCTHVYHRECISLWLNGHSTCPLCRAIVTPIYRYVEDGVMSEDRLEEIREEIQTLKMYTKIGAYGFEILGKIFSEEANGLGSHLCDIVDRGGLDEGFERVVRKETGGWFLVTIGVLIGVINYFVKSE